MNIKSGLGLQTKIDVLSNKISSLNGKKKPEDLKKIDLKYSEHSFMFRVTNKNICFT